MIRTRGPAPSAYLSACQDARARHPLGCTLSWHGGRLRDDLSALQKLFRTRLFGVHKSVRAGEVHVARLLTAEQCKEIKKINEHHVEEVELVLSKEVRRTRARYPEEVAAEEEASSRLGGTLNPAIAHNLKTQQAYGTINSLYDVLLANDESIPLLLLEKERDAKRPRNNNTS